MKKFIQKTFLTFFFLGMLFSYSKAAESILPEVMVGNPTITMGGKEYYGGFSGSETVYNHTNDDLTLSPVGPGQKMGQNLGPSLSLNGTNGYVDAGTSPSVTGTGAFTFSAWIKRAPGDSIGKGKRMILTQALDSGRWVRLMIEDDWSAAADSGDRILFFVYGGGSGYFTRYSDVKILPTDTEWHHVVASRGDSYMDGAVSKSCGTLWIDGVKQNYLNSQNSPECSQVANFSNPSPGTFSIGKGGIVGIPGNNFKGNIDDVRIYNRALSDTEVQKMYEGTFDEANKTGLKAHWDFNNVNGNTIPDSSGNNYSATVVNASLDKEGPSPVDPASTEYNNFGYDLFGFDKTPLADCVTGIILGTSPDRCFNSNSAMNNVVVMTSRTSIGSTKVNETGALFYSPSPFIIGDAYLKDMDSNNFAYWGKNLILNNGSTGTNSDSYWGFNSYTSATDGDLANYKKKITAAKSEAAVVSSNSLPATGNWYLQAGSSGSSSISNDAGNSDKSKYPNGKVWNVSGNVEITGNVTYSGKGTLIINGDLTINEGFNITPLLTDQDSRLGIVVTGNITMAGHNNIQAAILGYQDFIVKSNSTLVGSFVASRFSTLEATPPTITNTRLIYDPRFNKSWPPLFGEFKMPHSSE